jgi:hypothetical protein
MIAKALSTIAVLLLPLQLLAYSVAVEWAPVPDIRVSRYEVHYGSATGVYDHSASFGAGVTTATISGLPTGVVSYLAVRACSVLSCGTFSSELNTDKGDGAALRITSAVPSGVGVPPSTASNYVVVTNSTSATCRTGAAGDPWSAMAAMTTCASGQCSRVSGLVPGNLFSWCATCVLGAVADQVCSQGSVNRNPTRIRMH